MDFQIASKDLKVDIDFFVSNYPKIKSIYLFGSRAYKTNSTRSDIDIIIFSDEPIPARFINTYHSTHEYLDIFTGDKNSIVSSINGSRIYKRGWKKLISQLDAIELWNNKEKHKNVDYYKQEIFQNQRFIDSVRPTTEGLSSFKKKINIISNDECLVYFNESMIDYHHGCLTSCVSMIGLACEMLIESLVTPCEKKYAIDNPGRIWINTYANGQKTAKSRLIGLEEYFKAEKSFFESHGHKKLQEMLVSFDVIRNYRNNADHPSQYMFEKGECDQLYASISIHLEKIVKLTQFMQTLYP